MALSVYLVILTSAKDVMYSSVFICLLSTITQKNNLTDLHKIWYKGSMRIMEKNIRFYGYQIML